MLNVACVLIPNFAFKAELQRSPQLAEKPVLIIRSEGSRRTVADFSSHIPGIQSGMLLQEAVTFARDATLVEADDAYYHALFDEVLTALEQCAPDVEDAGLGCAYVGLEGLEGIYGGHGRLVLALQNAVPSSFGVHIGVGRGRFVAYVAAASAGAGRAVKAPEHSQRFLAGFSVDILPVGFKTKVRLHEFALHMLGDVAALPLGPLQAQFGSDGKQMWELANGIEGRPLIPRKVEEVVSESLAFPVPTATLGTILMGVEALLGRAFLRPELGGRCARLCTLQGQVYRRAAWAKRISFKEPVVDKNHAMHRIKGSLETTGIPGPLEDITLTLVGLTGEAGHQTSLFSDARKHEQLNEAIKQLEATFGKSPPIFHVREVEPWSRIPERRHAMVQFGS